MKSLGSWRAAPSGAAAAAEPKGSALQVLALALAAVSFAQAQSAAAISGRVVDATSGQAVAGVVVRLDPAGKQAPILTGPDGRFVFSRLTPGLYRLSASKPGYLDSAYGQMRASGQGTMLLLAEGRIRDDAVIRLWPWGTISGRVVDEQDRPVAGIGVQAWRAGPNGRLDSVLSPLVELPGPTVVPVLTDSEGRYTITRLPPGGYVLGFVCGSFGQARSELSPHAGDRTEAVAIITATSAGTLRSVVADPGGTAFTASACTTRITPPGERARMYVSAFNGGATSPSSGTPVRIAAGDTIYGIDLTVRSALTSRVAGTVLGTAGPIGVRLLPSDWPAAHSLHTVGTLPDGSFVFVGVTPGTYRLLSAQPERFWIDHSITVEADIDGLIVTARPGVMLVGEIHADGTPSGPLSFEFTFNNRRYGAQAKASATFAVADIMPGTHLFAPKTSTSDWQIVAATLGGRDVFGTMIDVDNKNISGLVLHFSNRPISIVGNVTDPRGSSSPDASVVLFPADPGVWTSARDDSPVFRTVRTWEGHYVLERIPIGEYVLAAIDDATLEEWPDAALLSRIAAAGQRIRVNNGQQIQRDLRVDITIR